MSKHIKFRDITKNYGETFADIYEVYKKFEINKAKNIREVWKEFEPKFKKFKDMREIIEKLLRIFMIRMKNLRIIKVKI